MTDWAKLKVVDLKAELKSRGLAQHGLKNELVARLEEAEQDTGSAEPEAEPEDAPVADEPARDEPATEEPAAADPEREEAVEKL